MVLSFDNLISYLVISIDFMYKRGSMISEQSEVQTRSAPFFPFHTSLRKMRKDELGVLDDDELGVLRASSRVLEDLLIPPRIPRK